MRETIRKTSRRHKGALWRSGRIVASHIQLFTLVLLSILLVYRFATLRNGANLIWLANAILLVHFLLAPRWKWPAYALTGFIALCIGSYLVHEPWGMNVLYNVLDLAEALGAAWLLRTRSTQLPHFTDPRYLVRFLGIAALGMPALAGGIDAILTALWFNAEPLPVFVRWLAADALGIAFVTPSLTAIYTTRLRTVHLAGVDQLLLVFCALFGFVTFAGSNILLLFALYPLLTLVTLRMGQGWGALALFAMAGEASWFTLQHRGPFTLHFTDPSVSLHPSVMLQAFMVSGIFVIYAVSAVVDTLRATERRLSETATLHNTITTNLRDIVILAGFDGRRTYVSDSAAEWGGWTAAELLGKNSFDLIHPSDLESAIAIVKNIRKGGDGGLIECRVQRKDGHYIWVEANVRPVHDPATGIVTGVLNIVRDVSQRKAAEKQLRDAYRTLEALAITDGLTRLANRRHFDQRLQQEWRRSYREQSPLSLLLLDVDLFKSYNDTYGHLRGDSALQQVADTATDLVTRPGDLVARFGGEEFVVVLPNTPSGGAMRLAEKLRHAVQDRRIPHTGNPHGIVTVSIGCATMIPSSGQHAAALIERADTALYGAKHAGRNRVCNSGDCAQNESVSQAS